MPAFRSASTLTTSRPGRKKFGCGQLVLFNTGALADSSDLSLIANFSARAALPRLAQPSGLFVTRQSPRLRHDHDDGHRNIPAPGQLHGDWRRPVFAGVGRLRHPWLQRRHLYPALVVHNSAATDANGDGISDAWEAAFSARLMSIRARITTEMGYATSRNTFRHVSACGVNPSCAGHGGNGGWSTGASPVSRGAQG